MRQFTESENFLRRAEQVIPLGSQTFSKSRTQYPFGVSPYFINKGKGSRVWDLDGNEYIDFVNGLASITLGYQDPDVTAAVREQLEDGVIFSLPHPLETEVAELICDMVPCAEMVRFGKNGSDATSGAIRVARAFTGRDRVAVCGYHGWQDWYIGSTARNLGVPQATRDLTHTFAYNDLDSLKKLFDAHPGEFATVILEPMNVSYPTPEFLYGVRDLSKAHGALLVFDETITGFRFANGGAQQELGVTPDLATFGKGLANGYAVSAVAGRRDVMRLMEEVGETLSLAAAKATLLKLKREPVVAQIKATGERIMSGVQDILDQHGLGDIFGVSGHPAWNFLLVKDARGASSFEIKTLWMQEIMERGILSVGTHNVSYAHSVADVDRLLAVYGEVLPAIGRCLDQDTLKDALRCQPLVPLFKVR
jgi:glutamate-1-semialdehyde 2,1-aminomutase